MANEVEIVIKGTDRSQAALGKAAAGAKKAGAEIESAQARAENATKQAAEAAKRAALDAASASLRVERSSVAAAEAVEKFGAESLQAREAAQRLAQAQDAQARAAEKAAAAERDAATAGERVARADREAAEASAAVTRKRQADAAATAAASRAKKDAAAASAAEKSAAREAAAAEDRHASSLHHLGGALSAAGSAARVAMVGGLVAVGVAAYATLKTGIDYQQQLNMMQAVTHATGAEMQAVAKRARDLGNDLTLPATSAGDAAHAMTELAKGNLTAQQAMDAAKGTLQLAAAAQIDGATAATIQADALNAFSLKATQASHVADVLANAANSATGDISDFAQGLAASSAVAHQFGLTVDDTVTALALFANAGIHGSDAGTSLKSALLALASPSKQAADALKVLRLHAFDAHGNFVGLESVSQQLATAQGRLSQQTFAAATSTAFGSDAARAAGVLAANGAAGWEKMAKGISRSGGAADAAKAQMKGVGGAIAGIKSQLETISIDVFTAAAPGIERFLHWVADQIPKGLDAVKAGFDSVSGPATAFSNGLKGAEEGLAPIGALLPALNGGLKPIGEIFDKLGASGAGIAKGMAPVAPVLSGIGAAGKGAADVFTSMGPLIGETATLMGDAAKPIGPLIKAAGDEATNSGLEQFFYGVGEAVAKVIVFVRRNAETWQKWASTAGDVIKRVSGFVHDFVTNLTRLDQAAGGNLLQPLLAGILAIIVAVKVWAVVQGILNVVLAANPVGLIVLAIIGLGAALIVAWKHSETFRKVVTTAFKTMALFVLTYVDLLVHGVLEFFGAIVHGAAMAFGWLPGIGGKLKQADAAFRGLREQVYKQFDLMRAKVNQFGAAAAKPVRKDVTIRVIDKATGVMQSITRYADALSGRVVSVKVGAVRGAGAQIEAHGGIIGAAGGGPRSALAWVGEQGPELVRLPYGSTVIPNGQSMNMANASQSGGGGVVVIQVQPGGTGLDRVFVDWLREAVRGRGGVDVVFAK